MCRTPCGETGNAPLFFTQCRSRRWAWRDVIAAPSRHVKAVTLWWMDREGGTRRQADIAPGGKHRQQTRPGAVWRLTGADGESLGYIRVGDRTSRAVIPR